MSLYLDTLETLLLDDLYRPYDPAKGWPTHAMSMIGRKRMADLREACVVAIAGNVPGAFVETGIWRGGAVALMAGVAAEYYPSAGLKREVWGFDSFAGVPPPSAPQDEGVLLHTFKSLAVPRVEVERNLERLGLLDGVHLVEGWFSETIPAAAPVVGPIAVLRLDGDLYESTLTALTNLYPQLSLGGYCIIDDYGGIPQCRRAVDDYRARNSILAPMEWSDADCVWWRK